MQNFKIFWMMVLLHFGFCIAMGSGTFKASDDNKGIKIISATCRSKKYDQKTIYEAVNQGMTELQKKTKSRIVNDRSLRYFPKGNEFLPFKGPYYSHVIETWSPLYLQKEVVGLVIFTAQGKLVNVVSRIPLESNQYSKWEKWRYENCDLEFDSTPTRKSARLANVESRKKEDKVQ